MKRKLQLFWGWFWAEDKLYFTPIFLAFVFWLVVSSFVVSELAQILSICIITIIVVIDYINPKSPTQKCIWLYREYKKEKAKQK